MEASFLPTSGDAQWAEHFSESLERQRDRLREVLAAQQQRLAQAESQLAEQLQLLADQLAQDRFETRQAKEDIEQRSAQFAREIETIEGSRRELKVRQRDWEQLQQRAAQQQEAFVEQVRLQQDGLDRRFEELERRRGELEKGRLELESRREGLDRRFEELERRRAELEQIDTSARDELGRRLDAARRREAALTAELESLRDRGKQPAEGSSRPAARPPAAADERPDDEDYHRRYELALEDLHELRARIAELEQQLAKAQSATAPSPTSQSGVMSWEAEKKRILAALESTSAEHDPHAERDRLKIEEVIRTTDQLLAEKDREIAELKHLLQDQSGNLGAVAVGAAAIGGLLDQDAIIREERENLKRLQDEWQGKLRQAEVEISVERAKIARDRAQLEERLQVLQSLGGSAGGKSNDPQQAAKPVRGRWLVRLGLKDSEDRADEGGKGKA